MTRTAVLTTLILLSCAGCSAFKEQAGDFITESVVDHIAEKVDQRLERRGLSIQQIRSIADLDNNGSVDTDEIKETAVSAAEDLVESYSAKLELEQRAKWEAATKNLVTRDEQAGIKGDLQDFWTWLRATFGLLITTVVGYLVKQVFSAKSDGRRDVDIARNQARMDALEKLLNRDLNNDGLIGGAGGERVEASIPRLRSP